MPAEAAAELIRWMAAAPIVRWPLAVALEWPPGSAARVAAGVRAMAAAKVVLEVAAEFPADDGAGFRELITDGARRWLNGDAGEGWAEVARAALLDL